MKTIESSLRMRTDKYGLERRKRRRHNDYNALAKSQSVLSEP